MGLINEYIVKNEILQMISKIFDNEIENNNQNKEKFLMKIEENIDLILNNKKWDKF